MIPSSDRLRALELLLGSMNDYLGASPHGAVWSGYSRAESGPAPSSKRPCSACSAVGRTIPSGRPCVACAKGQAQGTHPCVPCSACAGRGWVFVDDYTGQPVAHEERRQKRVASSGARARSHAVTATGLETHAGRWETAREKADRTGSYAALRRCLARLAVEDPNAHRLVVSVWVFGNGRERTQRERRRLDRGMVKLSNWMPVTVRLPQHLAERLNGEQRATTATDMRKNGASLREVSRATGARARHRRALRAVEARAGGHAATPAPPKG